jgi:hypothetical protein
METFILCGFFSGIIFIGAPAVRFQTFCEVAGKCVDLPAGTMSFHIDKHRYVSMIGYIKNIRLRGSYGKSVCRTGKGYEGLLRRKTACACLKCSQAEEKCACMLLSASSDWTAGAVISFEDPDGIRHCGEAVRRGMDALSPQRGWRGAYARGTGAFVYNDEGNAAGNVWVESERFKRRETRCGQ